MNGRLAATYLAASCAAVTGLAAAQPGGVLEVKPGGGHPDILLLAPATGGSWRAVTAHCTHKGCVVSWNANGGEFPDFNAINAGTGFDVNAVDFTSDRYLNVDQNRTRPRLRARLGVDVDVGSGFTSGIRIGSPAITSRGFNEADAREVGRIIGEALGDIETGSKKEALRARVAELTTHHDVP